MSGWALWDPDVLECLAETDHAARFDPHIADMRAAIEPVLAALAASRAKADQLVALQSQLRDLQQAPDASAEIRYLSCMVRISGNPFADNALNLSAWACKRYRHVPLDAYGRLTASICQASRRPRVALHFRPSSTGSKQWMRKKIPATRVAGILGTSNEGGGGHPRRKGWEESLHLYVLRRV